MRGRGDRRAARFGVRAVVLLWLPLLSASLAADLPEIESGKTLRVVVWVSTDGELFSRAAGPPGFEREILEGFAALQRVKLEVVPSASLDQVLNGLAAGQADVAAGGLVATDPRRKLVDFTNETFPIRHVVVTRRPHPVVDSLEALRRESRVGSIKGSSWSELAALYVSPERIDDSFRSGPEVTAALQRRAISATGMTVRTAMIERKRDPELQLGVFVGPPSSSGYAVRKDEPRLLAALNTYIDNVRRTATWNRLVVKYFGDDALEVLKRSRER